MGSDWTEARLDKITKLIVDCPHSTPEWTADGVLVLRNQYIRNGRLDLSAPSFTTRKGYEQRIKRGVPTAGDLVLTREAPMGEVCQIPEDVECCLGQRMVLIRADKSKVDPTYLLYVFQSPYFKHQVSWNEGTGTTVSNIRIPNIKAFQVPIPEKSAQKAIAHILGTLDDKIELNRRMNETLESMARALFKSWFVDFDPVIDNALAAGNPIPEPLQARAETRRAALANATADREAANPFTSAFQQTEELGWTPQGWKVTNVGNHVSLQRGTTYKSRLKGLPGPYLLGLGSIQRNGGFKENTLKTYGGECPSKMVLKPGDIFVSLKDLTQAADLLGSVARLPHHISSGRLTQDTVKLVFNLEPISQDYIYNTLLTERYRKYCRSYATGTTNLGLAREDFFGYPFVIPSSDVQDAYDYFVQSCNQKHQKNTSQSKTLTKLRDTLLPKLLSGELRIPDAEKLVANSL